MPLPTPIGRQHEVLYLPAKGHLVVLGTAGSGKTTIAILRSAYLADPNQPHAGPTLLVTFNKALVTYLRYHGAGAMVGVTVEHYHRFARGYVNSRRPMRPWGDICDPDPRRRLIEEAVRITRSQYGDIPLLTRTPKFFEDEIHWIASHGYSTEQSYVEAERVGRAAANMPRRLRPTMFDVYQTYLNLRRSNGMRYDWDDLAGAVVEELAADTTPRRYRHIVIDEGQDFSPQMLRSLAMAADPEGSVSFFGDYAQQVYGTRMSWRQAGLEVPRSGIEYFKENYRNSRPIARLALAISQMEYFQDVPDLVEPRDPLAEGPPPTTVRFSTIGEELDFVVEQASRAARRTSVAVLFRDRADEEKVAPKLPGPKYRLHRDLSIWTSEPGIYYGTYHAAKGMEFQNVILPFCSTRRLPDKNEVEAFGREEALARDGRLLYVGITRARSGLIITHTGEPTELLPAEEALYQRVTR